ncbi:MAG: HDOD domain-containing protein, partial [Thiomonas sp.]
MSSPPPDRRSAEAPPFRQFAQTIARQNLPAFGATLHEVFAATDAAKSGQQIAEIILRDPALTSMVLRAANTASLGYSGQNKVVTVSRAVVVLGMNAVRSLCLSALAVEKLATASAFRPRVLAALGMALHAAVQARDLGQRQGMRREDAERLFVEALLGGIGDMAFWCHGADYAQRLQQLLDAGVPAPRAEQTVLGVTLQQFGRELLQAWDLHAVLRDSPQVALADSLSRAAQHDWDSAQTLQISQRIATLLDSPLADTRLRLQHNAEQARLLAHALGAGGATQWIAPSTAKADAAEEEQALQMTAQTVVSAPDAMLQLRMLTEMVAVASTRRDLPLLFQAALEGLHRAVGLDRCVLCLISPARDRLAGRLGAGQDVSDLRMRLQWPWPATPDAALRA